MLLNHPEPAAASAPPADAIERTPPPADPYSPDGWIFQIDDDTFVVQKDRDYTGGLSFRRIGPVAATHPLSLDPLLGSIDRGIGLDGGYETPLHSVELGMVAFTPEEVHTTAPQPSERPYASLMYLSNARQYLRSERSTLVTVVTVGLLGLKAPGHFQNALHHLFKADGVEGWGNQISDGGEPTLRYRLALQHRQWYRYHPEAAAYEVKTSVLGSLGYLTGAAWGMSGRWGRFQSPWWSFNPQLDGYGEKSAILFPVSHTSRDEFYVFAGFNLSLRLYNVFLQGQFRDNVVEYGAAALNPILLESWLGIVNTTDGGTRISYSIHGQTSEIRRGPSARHLLWAGLTISRAY